MAVSSAQPSAAERTGLQVTISPLLVSCLVAAVVATVALVVVAVFEGRPPPPAPPGQRPPPPPSAIAFVIATGVFTIAWIAVIMALCRDQIVRRIGELEERLAAWTAEYGEQRETDGYLKGARLPIGPGPPGGEVRHLHPRLPTE